MMKRPVLTILFGLVFAGLAGCSDEPVPVSGNSDGGEARQDASAGGGQSPEPASTATYAKPAADRSGASQKSGQKGGQTAQSGELVDPSGYDIYWVYVDWSGNHPDYAKAAERNAGIIGSTYNDQTVNEFNRAEFIEMERVRLQSLGASSRGIGFITTNIGGRLGDYDPGYGEFYVGPLTPGSSISFSPTGWQVARETYKGIDVLHVKLRLTNALDGYVWKVSPEKAQEIITLLEREGNPGRQIYARARLQLDGIAVAGDRPEMNARVLSYTLHTEKGTLLGEFDLR